MLAQEASSFQGLFRATLLRTLGGSWVVLSRVTSPLIGLITIVTLLITPLITTHEPPSSLWCLFLWRDSARFRGSPQNPWGLLFPKRS